MSEKQVTFSDVNIEDGTLNFVMSGSQEYGLDKSVVNAIRRVLLTEIPTVAFRVNPDGSPVDSDLIMVSNQTSLHNEMMLHRVSMVPLYLKPETFMKNYLFECKVKHDTAEPFRFVTMNDLSVYPLNAGLKQRLDDFNDESIETSLQEAKKLLAELSIVKLENYDLTKPLKQSEKDEIFRPFVSDSEILGPKKNYSLLTELKTSGSDDTHQEIHFYGSPSVSIGQEHGRFQPVSSATYSFTRDDDLMETTLRNRISAESVSEEDIEAFERKFVLCEGDRYFHRDNFNEPNTYNFSVKSTHYYSSEMLFKKSIAILIDKCQKMKQSFIHLLQDKEHRAIDVEEKNDYLYHFTLYEQDHTMGNLIQSHIVRRSLGEDSILQLCGYKKPHPLLDKIVIHVSMKPEHAADKLSAQKLQMVSTFMIEQLDEISKELNDLLASAEEVM